MEYTYEELIRDTFKLVNKSLDDNQKKIEHFFVSKQFLCASYLIKYIENQDNDYYLKFSDLFKSLEKDKKIMVVDFVTAYYNANKKENQKVK